MTARYVRFIGGLTPCRSPKRNETPCHTFLHATSRQLVSGRKTTMLKCARRLMRGMIRRNTLIRWIVFLTMMATVYFVLPELNRGRILAPWTGQIAILIFMAGCLFLVRQIDNRRSRAMLMLRSRKLGMRLRSTKSVKPLRDRLNLLTRFRVSI